MENKIENKIEKKLEAKQEPPHVLSGENTSSRPSIIKKALFSRSKMSTYNGIIIAACVAILFWMLLNWDYKHMFSHSNKYTDNVQKTVKAKYQQGAELANSTIAETISKMKNINIDKTLNDMQETLKGASGNVIEKTKETISNLKDKHKEPETLREKSEKILENIKETSQETIDKIKETLMGTQTNVGHRFEMEGLIEQAHLSLQEFLSPHLAVEEQIPIKILSGAKAVMFLTVLKGGIGISGAVGTGIVIARNSKGKWGGPCAILLAGVDIGLNIGIEKSDHIIILRDENAIRAFESVGQLKLGLDASIAVGPKGRDASIGLSVGDKGYAAILSYSIAKGAYMGLSFEGQIIIVRNDCNEQFYGKRIEAKEILDGSIKAPKDKKLKEVFKILNSYPEQKEEI